MAYLACAKCSNADQWMDFRLRLSCPPAAAYINSSMTAVRTDASFDKMIYPADVAESAMLVIRTSLNCCPTQIWLQNNPGENLNGSSIKATSGCSTAHASKVPRVCCHENEPPPSLGLPHSYLMMRVSPPQISSTTTKQCSQHVQASRMKPT